MGRGSIPWIWRYCKERVLEGMADSLGSDQMRHMILEYRARQAMIDVGQWSNACRKLIDDNWLVSIEAEWSPYWKKVDPWLATPYANMYKCDEVDSIGWWRPEWRTTPGWSGANQIPLHVSGNVGDLISVHFKPLDTNMTAMLCYRTKQGRIYYSQPLDGEGEVMMTLKGKPANNVVILVVCNTDFKYEGEETRKHHFDYRLKMGDNVYQPAKAQIKWYNYKSTLRDPDFASGIKEIEGTSDNSPTRFSIRPAHTLVSRGSQVGLHITAASQLMVPVRLIDTSGKIVYQQSLLRDGDYQIPSDIPPGLYILQALNGKLSASAKIIIK